MSDSEERTCGGCTACCKTHAVFEIDKSPGRWCEHCNIGKGCRIYDTRPEKCREFRCEWLNGYGERPDRTKIVLDFHTEGAMGKLLQMWEVSEGALRRSYANEVKNECLTSDISVCCLYLDGRKEMFVPPDFVITQELLDQLAEEGIRTFRANVVSVAK